MSERDFEAYVRGLMFDAQKRPGLYRFRLLCWVLFGYLFVVLLASVALGLAIGIVWGGIWLAQAMMANHIRVSGGAIKLFGFLFVLALGALAFAFHSLRSLFIVIPEPHGLVLQKGQAIELFRDIEDMRRKLNVPSFEKVFVTGQLNAAAIQMPRYGIFGGQRNYFALGIPLLMTLSPEQTRAVLAHEMAHLSARHGAFSSWIGRILLTWERLLESLDDGQDSSTFDLVHGFASWYAPRLGIRAFALKRQKEFEADRLAAEVVGGKAMGQALIQLALLSRAASESDAPRPIPRATLNGWMNDALIEHDHFTDSHPSLSARLKNIGYRAELPEPMAQSASQLYLGENLIHVAASAGGLEHLPKINEILVNAHESAFYKTAAPLPKTAEERLEDDRNRPGEMARL